MSAKSERQIADEVEAYVAKNGRRSDEWYVGIAAKPRARLFDDHGVREKGDLWIHREAVSADAARKVEQYLIRTLSADGGGGGGDADTKHVYAYPKRSHTKP